MIWSKTYYRSLGYARCPYPHHYCGRLQSGARLMPATLRLRSENDLENRFLPCTDVSMPHGISTTHFMVLSHITGPWPIHNLNTHMIRVSVKKEALIYG